MGGGGTLIRFIKEEREMIIDKREGVLRPLIAGGRGE